MRHRWQWLLDNLDAPLPAALVRLREIGALSSQDPEPPAAAPTVFHLLQDRTIRVSWKRECRAPLRELFIGDAFAPVMAACEAAHAIVLRGRLFVALHMHAGDGNVHTNIPVNSDNYEMLQAATATVARIMRIARELGGVISGEHGIGITKLEFVSEAEISGFRSYKQCTDPDGRFNSGKLLPGGDLRNAYTPSFNLLGHESLIMQQSDLGIGLRRHQGLPAVRQVQAGVRHACAPRQPALQSAQQDPGDLPADRGFPLRGTDPPRGLDPALG